MKNKKAAQSAMLYIVIILVVAFLLYQGGIFAPAEPEAPSISEALPSDLQSTITMKFKDELATSETAVSSALWYAFASDGTYFNSGTASSGAASFTGNVQETYSVWAYTTGEGGYLAKLTKIPTGNKPRIAETISLVKRGCAEVSGVDDPIDLNQNISGTAGATEEFRVKWKVNVSNAGMLAPIIIIDTNDTSSCVLDVDITKADSAGGDWAEITCPDRISPKTAKHLNYCFQRDKMALSTHGTIITSVMIQFDATTTCKAAGTAADDTDFAEVNMMDTGLYLVPGYTTIDGIQFGPEDEANSQTSVGCDGDTAVTEGNTVYFNG